MTEAQYKLAKDQEREKAVKADKRRIEQALSSNNETTLKTTHMDILPRKRVKETARRKINRTPASSNSLTGQAAILFHSRRHSLPRHDPAFSLIGWI